MTTVFIVSSSPAAREALRRLAGSTDVRVVGEGEGADGMETSAGGAQVLLVDDAGLLETFQGSEDRLSPAVVLLTDAVDAGTVGRLRALDIEGWAILSRDAAAGEVQAAIVAAGAGLAAVPAGTAAASSLLRRSESGDEADDEIEIAQETLTGREREVLDLLGLGLSNKDVGVRLGISEHTAKFHVASVLAKLGAHNRAEAVRRGIRRGLVMV
jgi:two-component system, NarL family, nitrate/nitrite response regulator NarL